MEHQGFIFTKHALERLHQRSISKDVVVQTLKYPDETQPTSKEGSLKFIRTIDQRLMQVVATYVPAQKKWLVISVWVRGEDDQESLSWRLLTWPFKAAWWLVKKLIRAN